MDLVDGGRVAIGMHSVSPVDVPDLAGQVLPLPDAQHVEILGPAAAPELVPRPAGLHLGQVIPQPYEAHEVGPRHLEATVGIVGRLLAVGGPLPGILDGQGGHDDRYFAQAASTLGLEHHATEPRIDRQGGQAASDLGQPGWVAAGLDGVELLEEGAAVGHAAPVRRLQEWERFDVPEAGGGHL